MFKAKTYLRLVILCAFSIVGSSALLIIELTKTEPQKAVATKIGDVFGYVFAIGLMVYFGCKFLNEYRKQKNSEEKNA